MPKLFLRGEWITAFIIAFVGPWGTAMAYESLSFTQPIQLSLSPIPVSRVDSSAPVLHASGQIAIFQTEETDTGERAFYQYYRADGQRGLRITVPLPERAELFTQRVLPDGGFAILYGDDTGPMRKRYLRILDADGKIRGQSGDLRVNRHPQIAPMRDGSILVTDGDVGRTIYRFSARAELLAELEVPFELESEITELRDGSLFFVTVDQKVILVDRDGRAVEKAALPPVPQPLPRGIRYLSPQPPILLANGNVLYVAYNYRADRYTVYLFSPQGQDTGRRIEFALTVSGFAHEIVPFRDGTFAQISYEQEADTTVVKSTIVTLFEADLSVRRRIRLPGIEATRVIELRDGVLAVGDGSSSRLVYVRPNGDTLGAYSVGSVSRIRDDYAMRFRMLELPDGRVAFTTNERLVILKRDELPFQVYLQGRMIGQPLRLSSNVLVVAVEAGPELNPTSFIYRIDSRKRVVLGRQEVEGAGTRSRPILWPRSDGKSGFVTSYSDSSGFFLLMGDENGDLTPTRLERATENTLARIQGSGGPRLAVPRYGQIEFYREADRRFILDATVDVSCDGFPDLWASADGKSLFGICSSTVLRVGPRDGKWEVVSRHAVPGGTEARAEWTGGDGVALRLRPSGSDARATASLTLLDSNLRERAPALPGWGTALLSTMSDGSGIGVCPASFPLAQKELCRLDGAGTPRSWVAVPPAFEDLPVELDTIDLNEGLARGVWLSGESRFLLVTDSMLRIWSPADGRVRFWKYHPPRDIISGFGGRRVLIDPLELDGGVILVGGQIIDLFNREAPLLTLSFLKPLE